jgi:hypothetical protein
MSATQNKPSPMREDTIYLAHDRYVCGRVFCAGVTAHSSGLTIGGAIVSPVTAAEVKAWQEKFGAPLSCQCGAVTAAFSPHAQAPALAPVAAPAIQPRDTWCTFPDCIHHPKPVPVVKASRKRATKAGA